MDPKDLRKSLNDLLTEVGDEEEGGGENGPKSRHGGRRESDAERPLARFFKSAGGGKG